MLSVIEVRILHEQAIRNIPASNFVFVLSNLTEVPGAAHGLKRIHVNSLPKEFPSMKLVKLSFAFVLVFAFSVAAFAQSTTTGSIGGVVTNPAKEVVPGAAVSVKNMDTNKEDSATTDDTGRFKVANLPPGRYAVTVNASGFSPLTQENVVVEVGRETGLEVAAPGWSGDRHS